MKKILAKAIGALAVAALSTVSAFAQTTGTWNVDANGDWSTPGNWSGGVPSLAGDTANLTYNLTAAHTVNLDTSETVGILNLGDPTTGFFGYTLSGFSSLTFNNNGSGAQLNQLTSGGAGDVISAPIYLAENLAITNVNGLTLSGAIDGSGSIAKAGAGALTLSGANTYSGGTTLNAGTINFSNNASFGTGTITVNGGTIKNIFGVTTTNNLVVNSASTLDVTVGNWTMNGNISGSGAITRGTGATLSFYLGGDNSAYTGTFTSPNNGNAVVRFTSTTAGSAGASWVFNNATAARTTLEWNANGGVGTISFGSLTGGGQIQNNTAGAKTISAGALGLPDTFSGILAANGANTLALTKVGSGTMTLSGANTYTGDTTISAGTLTIGGAGKLGGGFYPGAIINNGSFNYSSSAAQTLAGPISGSGNLTNSGSGALTLSGACTFTGSLTANAGTLTLASPQSFSPSTVTVNDGATLSETFSPSVQMTASSLTIGSTTGTTVGFTPNSTSVARISAGTLTLNGANTINIIGGDLAAGSSYPLIAYTTLAGAGSYTLGTLPPGVAGNLSTTPGSPNIVYFNVTGVTNTVWTGAVNGTWDINTTANWTNAGTLGNTYLNGSPVQFDDTGLNTTTISNATATTLSPISVLVTNNVNNYAFKANTIIAGAASLTKTGTANLTNSTANTYTGPTAINKGQLVVGVASVANTSGALGNNSAVTLANDSTAVLNLNNFATQIGALSGGGLTGGNVVLGNAFLTVGGDNASGTYGGMISGTGGLIKIGTGTQTISGTNTYSGGTRANAGVLALSGTRPNQAGNNDWVSVNNVGAQNATLKIVSGADWGIRDFNIGEAAGARVAVYHSGTLTADGGVNIGNGGSSYAYYNLSAGTLGNTGGDLAVGRGSGSIGVMDVTGGSLTTASWIVLGRNGGTASGLLNVTGGSVSSGANNIGLNWGGSAGAISILNVGGGAGAATVTGVANAGNYLDVSIANVAGQTGVVNVRSNGTLTVAKVQASGAASTALFNFNGGTLKATAVNAGANFMNSGNMDAVTVYSGGGTIDNNGTSITIGNALGAATGNGVTSIAVTDGGSGYIGAPLVTFMDGTGNPATGYAVMADDLTGNGTYKVSSIVISSPGTYTADPTVATLSGGGATIAATLGTIATAANTSGGMTFQGSGTTTMTGNLSYGGATKVLGGTLVLNAGTGLPYPGGDLVVSNATLNLDASSGTMAANDVSVGSTLNLTVNPSANAINGTGNLTVGDNTTNNLTYGTVSFAPSAAAIKVAGTLTKGTNIVINFSVTGLQPGWIVPLIEADSTAMTTNGFVLGTLPPGIKAVLTNSTANTLDLLVTSAGQLLTWHGSEDGINPAINWDIATSTNWYSLPSFALAKYQQYLGNTIGDNVTFGDSALYTDGTNHVNLTTTVVPATVNFSTSTPYELHGAGGIGGVASVALTNNYVAVYLNTSNSYTGGTIVSGGTLVITNDNALGAVSGGLTLGGGALQLNAPITNSRAVTVTANSALGVVTNATVQLSGTLSGAGGLTKVDNGTLVLAGTNSVQGNLLVRQGTLTALGTNALPAVARVGDTAGLNGILTVPGGVFNANNNGGQYASSLIAGSASGAYGDIVINGGTLNVAQQLGLGAGAGGYAALNISSGALNSGSYIVVGFNSDTAVYNQNGGTVTQSSNLMTIAAGGTASIGVANFSGGTFNSSLSANSGIIVGERGVGTMNVSGSAIINLTNVGGLTVGPTGSQNGWDGTLNLNGGTVTANRIVKGVGTGTAKVNFNGGTIKAGASSATWLSGFDVATVYAGGLTVDDGGFAITIPQALVPATDAGVGSISLSDGGAGYIAPPIVTISGGSGSNATATATVSGGVVTAVVVTSPGTGYSLSDSLSVSFSGGGANVVTPTVSAVNLANNSSGSLTKLGNGTLTLSGASTYTGNTVINAGKLLVTPAHLATNGVSVAGSAGYGVTFTGAPGTVTNGAITLASGATSLSFGLGTNGNPVAPLIVCGPLTNNGTLSVTLGGIAAKMTVGSFPLVKYSGTIQGGGSLNPIIAGPQGSSITLSNSTASSTLYAVVNSLGSGIVWAGTNANPALTNVWDLNSTTNWLVGGVPTIYQETVPPGDAVVFNDVGSGLVLLSNTASPANMTISNNSVNYSFQGTGQINSAGGLVKLGTGTATLNLSGTYSVSTVVSNGTLSLGTNQTFANLTGNGTISTASGSPTLTVNSSANTTFSGALQGGLGLTKIGTDALTLSGTNTFTGGWSVNAGTLNYNGSLASSGALTVNGSGTNSILNIEPGASLTFNNINMLIGNNATNAGAVYQSGGDITTNIYAQLQIGSGTSAYGYYNLSGGTINVSEIDCGGFNGQPTGVFDMTGGTMTVGTWFIVGRANSGGGSSVFNMTGGTVNIITPFNTQFMMNWAANATQSAVINVANANLNATNATGGVLNMARSGAAGEFSGVNLLPGGVMWVQGVNAVNTTGTSHFNFNGGTLKASTANTTFLTANVSLANVYSGGGTIDNNGINITIPKALSAPAGNGLNGSVTLNSGGSGYIGAPAVTFSGDGTGATAYATVSGGAVTGVVITSPGVNYSSTPTVVFTGGGGTGASATAPTPTANASGGMTFTGTGVTTLSATNTYTGNTVVSNGTLLVNGALAGAVSAASGATLGGTGTIAGALTNNATLAPGSGGIGALTVNGNITLQAGSTNVFEVNGSTLAKDSVVAGSSVTYGGVLKIVPTGTFAANQQFQLFSGAGATNAGNFASIEGSPGSGLGFTFTNGVLSVVTTMATYPTNITATVNGSSLEITWPSTHLGWMVEAQTNAISVGLSNNWVTISNTATQLGYTNTFNPANGSVFYRLRKP